MSTSCDCDRQTTNGGSCDSSCSKEEVYDTAVENNTGPMMGSQMLAFTKTGKVVQGTFEQFGDGGAAAHA